MFRFNLKLLFSLVLIVGTTLMWEPWARTTELTANRLLAAREKAKTIPAGVNVEGLLDWLEIPPPLRAMSGFGSLGSSILYCSLSADCTLVIHLVNLIEFESVSWTADWPAIEQRAKAEDFIFYRNIIVTVLASLMVGWLLLGRLFRSTRADTSLNA